MSDAAFAGFDYPPEAMDPADVEAMELAAERERLKLIDHIPLRKMVDEFRDGTEPSRLTGEKCRRYFDGNQLDDVMLRALKRARQPRVIRNEIKPAMLGILGLVQQAKVDPKAYPRNPDNEEQSDVASKALRYVADANRFHKLKVKVAQNLLIEGVGGAIVEADDQKGAAIRAISANEAIYDPRSKEADFSDARYKGIGKWMYVDDVERMFPVVEGGVGLTLGSTWAEMGLGQEFSDKPDNLLGSYWVDKKSRRVFVVELYHREDVWMHTFFYVGGVLAQEVSPYLDEYNEPMCPIEFGSCYIDQQNQRTGIPATMLSQQDELNAYASRALHLSNSRQLRVADPNFPPTVSSDTARVEAAKADGVLPDGYDIVPTNDLLQGILLMMADARQAIVRQAPTPAVLAEASAQNQSGRSRLVLQQAGMTELALALGEVENWENGIYRQAWLRLKQFKTEPWWVRITGDDGKPGFAGVNMPTGPDGQPIDPQQAQMMQMQGQPVQISNRLAEMDVDIEVETIPDTANLQAEQFEALAPMLPLLASVPEFGPKKAFEVGLALSSIPGKADIKEMIDAPPDADNPQAQQMAAMQAQMQQMAAQLAEMKAKADIEKTQSETLLNQAKIEQMDAEVTIKAIEARQRLEQGLTITE
jgi:hypothetical protein